MGLLSTASLAGRFLTKLGYRSICMAQDGGVDPHNIAVAHGFLDRFRGRPELSCILEVPDRIERSIAELQSAAFASWLRNHLAPG